MSLLIFRFLTATVLIFFIKNGLKLLKEKSLKARKFFIRRNNNKVNSIETEHIVIADLLPRSDLEK